MWPFESSKKHAEHGYTDTIAPNATAAPSMKDLVTETAEEQVSKLTTITGHPNERLSIPLFMRVPVLAITSFSVGFFLGSAIGAPKAAYRYRAENAHRMPTSRPGWFLYQKSKNYHAIIGGVTAGVKMGGVLTGWATLFMATEEVIDLARMSLVAKGDDEVVHGQRDVASTVVAAMSTAGIYSWKQGMDKFTAARTARMTLKYSLFFGIAQDAAATLRGDRPAYVDWLARRLLGAKSTIELS